MCVRAYAWALPRARGSGDEELGVERGSRRSEGGAARSEEGKGWRAELAAKGDSRLPLADNRGEGVV